MTDSADWARLIDAIEGFRKELVRLNERVAALEKAAPATGSVTAPAEAPAPAQVKLSEELVLVIGAAVAAFLGKRPHIRQIRLLGSNAWAQQGRVTIQASHTR